MSYLFLLFIYNPYHHNFELLDTLYHLNAYKLALKKGCFGKYTMECIDEARTKRPHYPEVRQPIEDMVASLR